MCPVKGLPHRVILSSLLMSFDYMFTYYENNWGPKEMIQPVSTSLESPRTSVQVPETTKKAGHGGTNGVPS